MAKLTEFKKGKIRKQFKELSDSLMPLINDLMNRNKFVNSWEELSEEDLRMFDSEINGAYFHNYDFDKAASDGLISKEHAEKIRAFRGWNDSLGVYDD
jgi:hypothetical protein